MNLYKSLYLLELITRRCLDRAEEEPGFEYAVQQGCEMGTLRFESALSFYNRFRNQS